MNEVLEGLQTLFKTSMTGQFAIRRVEVGTYADSYNLTRYKDSRMIWIEPLDEEIGISNFANSLEKRYPVRIYIIMLLRNPMQSQVSTGKVNEGRTLNEYTNEMIRILGTNKTLNGKVRQQDFNFKIEKFTDLKKRQVKSIRVSYTDPLIPWASQTIDQNDMTKQI